MSEFRTIQNFGHETPFRALLHVLEENTIPYQTEIHRARIEPIGMTTLPPEFVVKVQPENFALVNGLLQEIAADEVQFAETDHYLFGFKDEELFDILASPDEWTAFDYQLAPRILSERGIDVDTKLLDLLNKSRFQELSEPEAKQTANVWLGYVFALFGGIVGIFMGWQMATARKTLPNGERVYVFQESDRGQGKIIIVVGLVAAVLWAVWLRGEVF